MRASTWITSSLKNGDRKSIIRWLAFTCVVVYMAIVSAVCAIHAYNRVGQPFPGFLYYELPAVGSMGVSEWAGLKAGMRYRDVILEINGERIATGRDIEKIVKRTPVGDTLTYMLNRRGEPRTVSVPVSVFGYLDLLKTFGLPFLMGLAFWGIGTIVYILKPNTETTWAFLLGCLFVGTYLVTGLEAHSNITWGYFLSAVGNVFLAPAFGHLSLLFPERRRLIQQWPKVPLLLYAASAVLFAYNWGSTWFLISGRLSTDEILRASVHNLLAVNLIRLSVLLSAVAIVASGVIAYFRSTSRIAKQRARVAFFSCAVAFAPPTLMQALTTLGKLSIPFNLTAPFVVAFPAGIGFAIARHNLFDVDVYIKRTVGYGIMTGVVALTYFAVQTVVSKFVLQPAFGAQAESVYPIVFALLIVFFFNPINRRVQEGVEKLFFRKAYDYKATVASIGDALTSLVNLDAILIKVSSIIRTQLFLDRVGVVVLDPGQQACRFVSFGDPVESDSKPVGQPVLRQDDPLVSVLEREKRLITKYDIAEDPRFAPVRESCSRSFAELGASVVVPLLYQDTFAGMLAVGYKKSGHFYSRDDIDLFKTASTMTATAIEQAREKEQRGTLMQLFSKHVSPEVAEALWRQRDQFLDGGRPRSQKQIVTVMFTDLQGFTSVSEQFDPQVLMDWLNTYMDAIARTVMDHGGVVDDYFGDGVKVNFGVPVPRTTVAEVRQDAGRAVTCALSLEQEMRRLNSTMEDRGLPTLRMRVGINTGPAVAGSLGSADRMKYTTLGDTVNTAARLESFSKELNLSHLAESPCRILISESTYRYLGDQFETQKVGELSLKGKEEKVPAYCVTGRKASTQVA